jgi:hypothetical protein
MSLVLNRIADTSTEDYQVLHGQLQVGRIYKRKITLQPGSEWLWALNGVPEGPCGLAITGLAASLDGAMAALKDRWTQWLAAAELTEST